ncbi:MULTISPECIES: YhjD/YihY/BrkB family envelope integrity protein [Arthrobacter]|uniref:YihY/virulence factor BrkB family protein n=1 Tax=Arthrobacter sunyaminii TaxID=2816859 RepID=A0A975PF55_9MICC|nr:MULTISPECIES: YhjD/YihY/BrkB family envelope integrity protein [Arthrobacter]MBO0897604.1 YihY/virulence factor BrkB family protein [Arthrobacter sunyaminii]MBO0908474.1 YihY/virulence factor BrkB family protein [Arthrobacter sunyaminii]QWQ35979.1 YihY/virulence factor BrkB family protein [Arthrobacter sunyaminii]
MAQQNSGDKAQTAPSPDDASKPDTPAEVTKPNWKYIARKTIREFSKDQCTDLAAALTYYTVLALFPALLALVSILGVVGQAESTTKAMLELLGEFAPASAVEVLEGPITQLTSSSSAGFALIIGIVGALWSASGYVKAFGRSMNRIYEVDEGRPAWKLLPTQLLVTLVLVLLVAALLMMLVLSGPIAETIGNFVGLGSEAVMIWNIAKWPAMLIFAVLLVAILYYATPNVKQPKFRWMSMGAFIALIVLGIVTLGFSFYVANFGNYNATYGAIGGVIVLLLWLWLANLSLLFGAEFDAEVERGRELQAGIQAEESVQLPPRDTRQTEKREAQMEEDIEEGRKLRQQHAGKDYDDDLK